jgi:hypothetical protein
MAASGAIAFPLIGAVVGLIGAAPLVLLGWLQPLSSLLALAVIAVVTGALHLDGLADTADALLARTGSEPTERARTPRSVPAALSRSSSSSRSRPRRSPRSRPARAPGRPRVRC